MIDLYTWSTPNGRKVSIMLEEVGLPYEVHPINIGQGDQFKDEFHPELQSRPTRPHPLFGGFIAAAAAAKRRTASATERGALVQTGD